MGDNFDSADFYCCDEDADSYTASSAAEAITDFLAQTCATETPEPGDFPVTVYAYRTKQIPQAYIRGLAEHAVDGVEESVAEDEYGSPDNLLSQQGLEQLRDEVTTAIGRAIRDHAKLWACEPAGQRDFSEHEVREMLPEEWEAQ